MIGSGGGFFKTGRLVTLASQVPNNQLLTSILHAMGIASTGVGDPKYPGNLDAAADDVRRRPVTRFVRHLPASGFATTLLAIGCGSGARSFAPGAAAGLVTGGAGHTCAAVAGGGVACWGANEDGELGDGTGTNELLPVFLPGLGGVAELAAGSYHTCARTGAGAVFCWGWNVGGQVGDGTIANRLSPFEVPGLAAVRGHRGGQLPQLRPAARRLGALLGAERRRPARQRIDDQLRGARRSCSRCRRRRRSSAGGRHTCALVGDGSVQCWGGNDFGELGDGTTTAHPFPEPVAGIAGAVAIAAGFNHTCALLADGRVACWGANGYGQLGDGTGIDNPLPVTVAGLPPSVAIAAGYNHSCAVSSDGAARCWGWNAAGQLGDGTTTDQPLPVAVGGLPPRRRR